VNDIFWLFVCAQTEEDRLPQLVIVRPIGEFDLGD
jgi:hypothetical protein